MTIQVQGYRWSQFLQRLFLARGGAGGAGQTVLDDILPVVELSDPTDAENRRMRGEDLFTTGTPYVSGSVAAQFNWAAINNPAGSGKLLIIEQVWAQIAAQNLVNVFMRSGALVGAGNLTNAQRDSRLVSNPAVGSSFPVPTSEVGSNGAMGTPSWRQLGSFPCTALMSNIGVPTVVLAPGSQLGIWNTTAAQAVTVMAFGYLRDVEPAELL